MDCNNFQPGEGPAYRVQTAPKPNQNHLNEEATPEGNRTPIFGAEGIGFTYKGTEEQQKLYGTYRSEQRNSTPGKASAAVQNMLNENSLPPSLLQPFGALLDNFTPQSKSTATASQEVLSQISNNSDAASIELLSQKSNISPSKDTNPEQTLNFDPSPERRPKRNSQPPPVFDVAQVQQEEKERKKTGRQETL